MKRPVKKLTEIDDYMRVGQFKRAIVLVTAHLREKPRSYKAWNLLGWAHLKNEDPKAAVAAFAEAIRLNPSCDNACVGKGVIFRAQGNFQKAKSCYRKAIRLCPRNAEALTSLSLIELLQHKDRAAVRHAEQAWRLRKDLPGIPANLAFAYHYSGDIKKRDRFYAIAKRKKYHNLKALDAVFSGKQDIR
jgi:Flp pilus assembly protein TadD